MQNIKTIAGTFTIGTYEIQNNMYVQKHPQLHKKMISVRS